MSPAAEPAAPQLPAIARSLIRAAAPWKRAATAGTTLPEVRAVVSGWRPDGPRLAEYRSLLGSAVDVPLAFPQVPVMALHMDLITRLSFPVRAIGLVHQGSVVDVLDDLPADEPWDLTVWGTPGRNVRAGLEFDLWGEVRVGGRPRWMSRAVYLSRSRTASGAEDSAVPVIEPQGPWDDRMPLPAAEDVGRSFARLTGDANPIHLHAATARPFGFRHPIAHGWWTTARITALLGLDACTPGRGLQVRFRRPVELPSTPLLVSRSVEGAVEFALLRDGSTDQDPPLVVGRVAG